MALILTINNKFIEVINQYGIDYFRNARRCCVEVKDILLYGPFIGKDISIETFNTEKKISCYKGDKDMVKINSRKPSQICLSHIETF